MTNESTKEKKTQYEKFIEAAKEHECDESEKSFDKNLGKIARQDKREKKD